MRKGMNVGIIGFGFMGHWHTDHMYLVQGITTVAVCDIDEGKRADAEQRGLRTYADYRMLLGDPDINTVLIATPNHLHHEMALAAAKAGKNIICEKPAALNARQFEEMVEAATTYGVLFEVHQNRRWDADFLTVKHIFEQKTVGNVFMINSTLYGANGKVHDWHCFPEFGGGMIYDWGVHLLDQMLALIPGKLVSVFADVQSVVNEKVDDYFKAVCLFENGISYTVEIGTYLLRPLPRWYVAGDQGSLVIKSFFDDAELIRSGEHVDVLPASVEVSKAGPTRAMAKRAEEALQTESIATGAPQWGKFFENYLAAFNGEEELCIKNDQVARVLRLMEAIRLSAQFKQSVPFEESL